MSPYTSCSVLLLGLLSLALSLDTASGVLRCWRCSTDVSNGEFCNDPFQSDSISEQQRYWSYVNCTYSVGVKSVNARPVCKKLVQEVYGKRVISRSCFYEDVDDAPDKCAMDTTSSYIKTVYCRTCTTDGCNSAGGLSGLVGLLVLPLLAALRQQLCK
ncbi:UPAR/Ly6 domain-containing protein twit isoform X1 [Drosophila montana]|uniref:UPAR/Ly6 domain-containing protein twit isoform X1 n=1 Tax=Drosophila montana TaxID=40370 RepID=UPI00313E9094